MGSVFFPLSLASSPGSQPDLPATLFTSPKDAVAGGSVGDMEFESLVSSFIDASPLGGSLAPVSLLQELEEELKEASLPFVWMTNALPPKESPGDWTLFSFAPVNSSESADRATQRSSNKSNPTIEDLQPAPPPRAEPGIAAFDGRILEIAEAAVAEGEHAPSPHDNPAAVTLPGRIAAAPQKSEIPALPIEKPSIDATPEASPALHSQFTQMPHGDPAHALEPERAVVQTIPIEQFEMPAAPNPSNGISVRLVDGDASSVHLRVAEKGGELTFDVRAANAALAGTLRQELPELLKRLQSTGYQVEIRQPEAVLQTPTMTSSESAAGGHDSPGHRRRRESRPGQQGKPSAPSKSTFSLQTRG